MGENYQETVKQTCPEEIQKGTKRLVIENSW